MAPVSVVIPCYRCADTVGRALASVRAQTLPVQEIILVDDASGDATAQKLREIERSDTRVRLLALPSNRGPASARNAGWNVASCDYIAFLDADDAWHPRKVELQHAFMQAHPEFALSGHRHAWLPDPLPAVSDDDAGRFHEVQFGRLLLSNPLSSSAVMLRRSVGLRFPEGQRHMEDHLLWMRLALDGQRMAKLAPWLSFRFSPPFGAAGLSRQLWLMERAELANYRAVHRAGGIGALTLAALVPWSLAKFGRRLVVSALRARHP